MGIWRVSERQRERERVVMLTLQAGKSVVRKARCCKDVT